KRVRAGVLFGASPLPRLLVGAGSGERLAARVAGRNGGLDCGGGAVDADTADVPPAERLAQRFEGAQHMTLAPGRVAALPVPSASAGQVLVGLRLQAPQNARPGESFLLDIVERDEAGRVVGG